MARFPTLGSHRLPPAHGYRGFACILVLLLTASAQAQTSPQRGTAITPSIQASRTTCVAPCGIHFDASATVHADASLHPFTDLEYDWNFGDPKAGNWAIGARHGPKNEAVGPLAAHVYERPGQFLVQLTIRDAQGASAQATTMVTVADPDQVFANTQTVCVAPDDLDWNGCPADAARVIGTDAATTWSVHGGAGRRMLLRRGDVFITPEAIVATGTGPGQVGAFGSGDKPVISQGQWATCIRAGSTTMPTSDFSFHHLRCEKPVFPGNDWSVAMTTPVSHQIQPINHILFAHIDASGYESLQGGPLDGYAERERIQHVIAYELRDLAPHATNGFIINFPFGSGMAWLGVHIDRQAQTACSGTPSAFRSSTLRRTVISQVEFVHTCTGPLRLHSDTSPNPDQTRPEKIVVSRSRIGPLHTAGAHGGNGGPVSVDPGVGPGNQIRDYVFEGNLVLYSANNNAGFDWSGRDFIARNNVFDLRGMGPGGGGFAVFVKNGGDHGATSRIKFINNTVFQLQGEPWQAAFGNYENATQLAAVNNALRTTSGTAAGQVVGDGFLIDEGNVVAGPASPDPLLTPLPSQANLHEYCPRRDGAFWATGVPGWSVRDFFGNPFPQTPNAGFCQGDPDAIFSDGFE